MANLTKIKTIAAQKGIELQDIANYLEMSQPGMSRIIREGTTKIDTLEKISEYLGVSPSIFFDSEPTMTVNGNNNTTVAGNGNNVNGEIERFLHLLEAKDKQMERLIEIISELTAKVKE